MARPEEALLTRIARWNLALSYEDIPASVLRKARWQIQSVLASVYAGRFLEETGSIARAVPSLHRGVAATLLATGERSSPEGAVLANTAWSMAQDYDDYLFMGHTGHSAVLVSLALCEAAGGRVSDWITCQVAANELAGRLGASALLGPLNGQMWSFIHLLSGACITGRMLGLDLERMEHAVAIALSQPPMPCAAGFFGSGAKLLTAAWPSVLGMQAARFAAQGLTGPKRVFDDTNGFYGAFSYAPIRGAWDGLGERWLTESLAVKRHPGCAYVDSALDALEAILSRFLLERGRALRPSDIHRIRVLTTLVTCEMERLSLACGEEDQPVTMNFSLRRSLAWRVLKGGLRPRECTAQAVRDAAGAVRELSDRIQIVSDLGMNRDLLTSLLDRAGLSALVRQMGIRGVLSLARQASARYGLRGHLPTAGRLREELASADLGRALRAGVRKLFSAPRGERKSRGVRAPYSLADVRPEDIEFPFAAAVELWLRDGTRMRAEQRVPVGAPGDGAVGVAAVSREKFLDAASDLMGPCRASAALAVLESADPGEFVSDIVPQLTVEGPGASPGQGGKAIAQRGRPWKT